MRQMMKTVLATLLLLSAFGGIAMAQAPTPSPAERALQATLIDELSALVNARAQAAAAQDEVALLQKQLDEAKKPLAEKKP